MVCANPYHDGEPVIYFCVNCEEPICTRCKLTKHQSHETDDFSEAADRSTDNLKESKIKLDKKISYLSNKHRVAQDNLRAPQGKRKASSEHVRMRRNILVKRIRTIHGSVQRQIESSCTTVEKRLTRDAHSIQEELESYQHLRQTLHHALSADASQLDQIYADKSIREGSKRCLRKIRKSMPATTLRPGLHVFSENVSNEDISRALGTPVELSVEFTPRETMVLVFEGQSTPFATYVPRDAAFCPSDVCFWQENGQDRLLVADRQNDCVHVLSIHEDRVGFERYLAAGDSTLVRPTALKVDDRGRVWVGCENGSVLLCKAVEMGPQVDSDESDEDDNSEISLETLVSDGNHSDHSSLLEVENSSHGTYDSCSSSETTRQRRNAQRRADQRKKI
ncbi:hypothetical protein ACOMHN_046370 [Nucella lapillus]